jgi:hypothetical protein
VVVTDGVTFVVLEWGTTVVVVPSPKVTVVAFVVSQVKL